VGEAAKAPQARTVARGWEAFGAHLKRAIAQPLGTPSATWRFGRQQALGGSFLLLGRVGAGI
jgi:hypothetical protein